MKQRKTLTGSGALLLAAVIWGFGYVVISDSLNLVDVGYLMAYRYILAALGMAIVFRKHLPSIDHRLLGEGAVLGLLLYFSQYVQTVACGHTTAGKVSFITALYVVLVPICGLCGFQQKMSRNHWTAVILALPGLFLLTQAEGGINRGDLLALAGSFGFAVHILFSDRFAQRDSVVLLSLLQFGWAAVYSTGVLSISGQPLLLGEISWAVGSRLIFMGLISTLMGFFLQMWGQKLVSPSLAAMLLSTEALFGLLFSVLLLHEGMTLPMCLGGVLMLAAILVAERTESK
jgi:drug/metabolite transporter (DMT)-like permease